VKKKDPPHVYVCDGSFRIGKWEKFPPIFFLARSVGELTARAMTNSCSIWRAVLVDIARSSAVFFGVYHAENAAMSASKAMAAAIARPADPDPGNNNDRHRHRYIAPFLNAVL
jgi:hypothetical protein